MPTRAVRRPIQPYTAGNHDTVTLTTPVPGTIEEKRERLRAMG